MIPRLLPDADPVASEIADVPLKIDDVSDRDLQQPTRRLLEKALYVVWRIRITGDLKLIEQIFECPDWSGHVYAEVQQEARLFTAVEFKRQSVFVHKRMEFVQRTVEARHIDFRVVRPPDQTDLLDCIGSARHGEQRVLVFH